MGERGLTQVKAAERFLERRQRRNTEKTVRSLRNRLQTFIFWAEENGIGVMSDLDGWQIDDYKHFLEAQGTAPTTVKGKMVAPDQLLKYCVSIGVVDEDLPANLSCPG